MTFDQSIDAVNAQVRSQLRDQVRTEELSWDSAMWVSKNGTAVAAMADDEKTAKLFFDGGDKLSLIFRSPEGTPEIVSAKIAQRLGNR